MQPIELHFSLGVGFTSALIAYFGYGYGGYSHVDAILSDGRLAGARADRVGGAEPGFRIRPPNYEPWKRSATLTIPATAQEHARWEAWQLAQVGDGYDQRDILGLIVGEPLNSGNGHWICSAAQLFGLQQIGKMPANLPFIAQQTTPNAVLFAGAAIGGSFVLRGPSA